MPFIAFSLVLTNFLFLYVFNKVNKKDTNMDKSIIFTKKMNDNFTVKNKQIEQSKILMTNKIDGNTVSNIFKEDTPIPTESQPQFPPIIAKEEGDTFGNQNRKPVFVLSFILFCIMAAITYLEFQYLKERNLKMRTDSLEQLRVSLLEDYKIIQ